MDEYLKPITSKIRNDIEYQHIQRIYTEPVETDENTTFTWKHIRIYEMLHKEPMKQGRVNTYYTKHVGLANDPTQALYTAKVKVPSFRYIPQNGGIKKQETLAFSVNDELTLKKAMDFRL